MHQPGEFAQVGDAKNVEIILGGPALHAFMLTEARSGDDNRRCARPSGRTERLRSRMPSDTIGVFFGCTKFRSTSEKGASLCN